MLITIKLFATLRDGRFEETTAEFPSGMTAGAIVRQLGLPEKEVTLIFINSRHADFVTALADGDVLSLFPPVGGG
jgi:molybdopterin converting factor small subunit